MSIDSENGTRGQYFDDFLDEQGLLNEINALAAKRVIAWQLQQAMEAAGLSKAEMARRIGTSRAQLDRLLDPENQSVTLSMLARAANAVGRKLKIELA